jgi:hypothetical protein
MSGSGSSAGGGNVTYLSLSRSLLSSLYDNLDHHFYYTNYMSVNPCTHMYIHIGAGAENLSVAVDHVIRWATNLYSFTPHPLIYTP